KLKQADSVMHLIHTTAHSYLLFFSNRGRVYRLKAHEVPVASRTARGTSIVNLLSLQDGERIQAVIDTRDYEMNRYLLFATAKGRVKRTKFTAYDSSRKAGLIAINLRDDDELVAVVPTDGVHDILLSSRLGQTIRFAQDEVREMSRTAAGVIGLRLRPGDSVVACAAARPAATLLHVTTSGYGKRTRVERFPRKHRAGLGVKGIRLVQDKGEVVGTLVVDPEDEILAATRHGVVIRIPAAGVSVQDRWACGVTVMSPDPGDEVVAIALVGDDINGNSDQDPEVNPEAASETR
ncbi:MAG: DNA gyrase subunit A, partial [Acidimicrobiaceae bacterium]|nr:DNA gyrase subunit A [Acidimicrobiaceae bacterium]